MARMATNTRLSMPRTISRTMRVISPAQREGSKRKSMGVKGKNIRPGCAAEMKVANFRSAAGRKRLPFYSTARKYRASGAYAGRSGTVRRRDCPGRRRSAKGRHRGRSLCAERQDVPVRAVSGRRLRRSPPVRRPTRKDFPPPCRSRGREERATLR